LADQGFDEPEDSRFMIRRPTTRSFKPVKPIQWRGGTREIGVAQKRLEGVYEKTKRHMEEMHDTWEKLEAYQCNGQDACLTRLQKLKRDLEEHIQGLEKRYVDSLEGQNNFLAEELERHLQEDRDHLSDGAVQKLRAYLEDLQVQNQDLAEKIRALRTEGDALVDSLEGRASPQETADTYKRASGEKRKPGSVPQGPLKVREALDSLTARFAELQREGVALEGEIAAERGHTCPGAECDHVRATLGHAQAYEAEMKDLEQKIEALRAGIARARRPNGVEKATADKKIGELLARVKELEASNTESMAALQAELAKARGAVAVAQSGATAATQRADTLESQQKDLSAKVETAQQTEASLRAEISEIQKKISQGHMTAQEATNKKQELEADLKQNQNQVAALNQKNYALEQRMKEQKLGTKALNAFQRARVQKAQEVNKQLTAKLEALGESQQATLAEIQGRLSAAEAARAQAEQEALALVARQRELDNRVAALIASEETLKRKMTEQERRHGQTVQQKEAAQKALEFESKSNQEKMTALERENASLIKEIGLKKPLLPTKIEKLLQEAQRSNKALQFDLTRLKQANLERLKILEAELLETKTQLEEARKLTTEQQQKIAAFEKQIKQLDAAKADAERREEAANARAKIAEDETARTTEEQRRQDATIRSAHIEAAQHKQKAEALEAQAHKAEAALAKLEGALGINLQGNELASLGAPQTHDQRLGALVLGIEAQRRGMEEQKTTLDEQAVQPEALKESLQRDQVQMAELQRVQKQQESTTKKATEVKKEINRLNSGTGYVDTRKLYFRIKELEDLLRKETEEKKRASDIVGLQKLALSKKRSELEKQAATMRVVEEERVKLEKGLKDQERNLQSQLKELKDLRDSKRQSGQTQDEFESALREKQKLVDELKASVAKAQGQFSDQQERITEQRKALSLLEKAHAKQKDILSTAYLVAQKLNTENDELRRTLETAGAMGQQALAERDTAKEEFRQNQEKLQKALQKIADLEKKESQPKPSKEQEERIAALEAEKRALLAKNIAQRWRQIAQQALVQRRLGTIKTAVGATEPAQDLGSELAAATGPLVKSFYESVKADADAILLAAQSTKKQLEQSLQSQKQLQERVTSAEDLVTRQREALTRTDLEWKKALKKQQQLETDKIKLEKALGALGEKSTEGQAEIQRMRAQLEKTKSDLSEAIKQKQREEELKDNANADFMKAIAARNLLEQEFKEVLERAADLNNQLMTEALEKEGALRELRITVESLQKEVAEYKKDDEEYARQGQKVAEVTAQARGQAAELKAAQEALKKAEVALQEEKKALEYRIKEYEELQGRFEDFKKN
jgi:chromosome segregation ATPase